MRTITDVVGSGPINIFAICDDDGRPTRWSGRSPTRLSDSEGIDAADGRFETDAEPNNLGSNKPLGVEVNLDYQSTPIAANDNAATGKAARSWKAMERANAGTLMLTAFENLEASAVLNRTRALVDACKFNASNHPSPSENMFEDVKSDNKAFDLNGSSEVSAVGEQFDCYVKYGPTPEALVEMGESKYLAALNATPWHFEERYDRARGPDSKKNFAETYHSKITLSGKVKPRSKPPQFNPEFHALPALDRVAARDEFDILRTIMGAVLFGVLVDISCFNANAGEVGENAGFDNKRADAVGLDRSRLAILAAVQAFDSIDYINDADPTAWWAAIPDTAVIPASMFKRLASAHLALLAA